MQYFECMCLTVSCLSHQDYGAQNSIFRPWASRQAWRGRDGRALLLRDDSKNKETFG